jgi:hypothetical protein
MDPASPAPADLPGSICLELADTLRLHLLAPVTDSPEDAARRQRAALEHAASLLPATHDEANLAALYVAASTQALDCLRLARMYPNDTAVVLRCTAQSAGMMRQARAFRAALERAQTTRRKRERAADSDAAATQARSPATGAVAEAPTPPAGERDPIAEAERYALQHRKRAVLIRRLGHLPPKFGWLAPEVVFAIATGTTPILRALDEKPARTAALAA